MKNRPQISIDTEKGLTMCFACGQDNPIGLKLNFEWDNKIARAEFTPNKFHQGWSGIVHGGIIGCLLDEAMIYAPYFEGIRCITAEMRVRIRRPALIDEPLIITSFITKKTRRLVEAKATISLKDGTPVAESTATMFVIHSTQEDASGKEGKA
jgi:acyl-coenzyme A thioesterase PaaI-like protein